LNQTLQPENISHSDLCIMAPVLKIYQSVRIISAKLDIICNNV